MAYSLRGEPQICGEDDQMLPCFKAPECSPKYYYGIALVHINHKNE